MREPRNIHRSSTVVMSVLMVLIGIVLLARTVIAGGGALASGMLLGLLFIVAGAARLYLQLRV
jgi:uncharacterized membrane protein HdeD (DUF308 family)